MGESPGSSINNIVNGSGLSSLSLTATHATATPTNAWGSTTTTGNITFNLNGSYNLAGFSLWNFNFSSLVSAGVNGVNIQTSTDGSNFTPVTGSPTQFAIATSPAQNAEQFSFTPVDAAYVRFNVLSNYGASFTGLGEVQFDSAPATAPATAVPEPFTIVGTLAGLGGGAALKRRLKKIESKSV
jgi:F5/8 type C domain